MDYIKANVLFMKHNPQLVNEAFIQRLIADDPSILGLGQLELKDKEHIQPGAGRLDLLLKDPEDECRYEVEVQLGETDPSHIIRTIEYWDNERRRYPEIDHVAVIVAEKITSRFFNVIGLFNKFIPIIAIQMTALEVAGKQTVVFNRMLDLTLKEHEQQGEGPTDDQDWKQKYGKSTLKIADEIQALISADVSPDVKLKFNKQFIGTTIRGQSKIFFTLRELAKFVRLSIKLEQTPELDTMIQNDGLKFTYDPVKGKYRFQLKDGDIQKHRQLLSRLIKHSYFERTDEVHLYESSSPETEGTELDA
ncbi:MAG: hypothetical protein ACP5EP_07945 [Acidobacteriaceae bacterium]